jgi:ribose transport system ATP-binding protein
VVIRNPAEAVRAGLGLVPEDRAHDGLLLSQSIRVNTTLGTVTRHARRGGWLDRDAETRTTAALCGRLGVRCASWEQGAEDLSGGNQQKVLIARALASECAVLLFDEPTRGIDVAAKDTIYDLLRDLASEGKAVVVVSSDLVELMALCDRLLVMSQGRITAAFLPAEWTEERITRAAFS